jgi:molecular chaperone GrpE
MRALADAENARKRADKDRREAEQYGGSKLSPATCCRSTTT